MGVQTEVLTRNERASLYSAVRKLAEWRWADGDEFGWEMLTELSQKLYNGHTIIILKGNEDE